MNIRDATVTVALFPSAKRDEPTSFLALLEAATEEVGARSIGRCKLDLRWSLTQHEVDVVHLHWIEYLAASDPSPVLGFLRTWVRIVRAIVCLTILRVRGVGIVWTIHNLAPHQPVRPRAEAICARTVYLLVDEIIVHSGYARARVRERFRGRRGQTTTVIPHANYVSAFPSSPYGRDEARRGLGLPTDAYVYLAFGVIRRYKRLVVLAEQFSALRGDDLRLLIAGAPNEPSEVDALRKLVAADPRIILRAGYVNDEEVPVLHIAADAAVLAYADVFSSGALLLALSCGIPAVVPAGGTAEELFGPPAVEFFEGDDLKSALAGIRTGDRSAAARAAAEAFPWSRAAEATVRVYRRAASRRRRAGWRSGPPTPR